MADAPDNIVARGRRATVEWAVISDDPKAVPPAKEFFDKLSANVRSQLLNVFLHIANNGEVGASPYQFKWERGEIWAFKRRGKRRMIRMPCVRRGDRWIISHGFIKPNQAKWPESEFTRTEEIIAQAIALEQRLAQKKATQ